MLARASCVGGWWGGWGDLGGVVVRFWSEVGGSGELGYERM